jgi:itaconate CoA-transferase
LTALICTAFADLTANQVVDRLEAAGIANAHINDMAAVWAHPQLAARNRWRNVSTPVGDIPALLPPGGVGDEARMDPIPALGEHSAAILAELGYSNAAIAALADKGVI